MKIMRYIRRAKRRFGAPAAITILYHHIAMARLPSRQPFPRWELADVSLICLRLSIAAFKQIRRDEAFFEIRRFGRDAGGRELETPMRFIG